MLIQCEILIVQGDGVDYKTACRSSSTVKVRLLRFWEAKNVGRGWELMGVDMLFLDSQAGRCRETVYTGFDRLREARNVKQGSDKELIGIDLVVVDEKVSVFNGKSVVKSFASYASIRSSSSNLDQVKPRKYCVQAGGLLNEFQITFKMSMERCYCKEATESEISWRTYFRLTLLPNNLYFCVTCCI